MKRHIYFFGQSLAEYTLIGALVCLGCIGGLSLFSESLSNALGVFQKSMASKVAFSSNPLPGGTGETMPATTESPTTDTTVLGSAASLTPAELSQLQTQNQQIQQLYSAVLNGTASPAEVAGSLGESSSQIYAVASKLTQLADEVQATDPAKASQILELAKTGKVLAGLQAATVSEIEYHSVYGGQWGKDFQSDANQFQRKVAMETGIIINDWGENGNIGNGNFGCGNSISGICSPNEAITNAQAWTTTFNQQYMALHNKLGQYNLSPTRESTLNNAAIEILAKSGTYTFENALNTYGKSKTIETVQTAP